MCRSNANRFNGSERNAQIRQAQAGMVISKQ